MKTYTYQNTLIGKKQLRQLLAWSFTNYDSMQACLLADELKYLGFKYASQAGISISIEDLRIPFVKDPMLDKSNQEIDNSEKIFLKGKITSVERFQKIIDTWSLTSESLKNQIIYYFKTYDPLNSVYIMAFSGARGNLSQVRQLVGMRGLMSDPSGQIMNLPIKKNFKEGLTITDYLMSGYGARKGIVDTALKTANSGYLTRRLIDVSQDIIIREKDCLTTQTFRFSTKNISDYDSLYEKTSGRLINKPILDDNNGTIIAPINTQMSYELFHKLKEKKIEEFFIRSPLTCKLYRSICQKCYGWDLSTENLIDVGEAIGILAGQSIGEPGTQLTMRTFHTGGIFTAEARQQIVSPINGVVQFYRRLKTVVLRTNRGEEVVVTKNSGSLVLIPEFSKKHLEKVDIPRNTILFPKNNQYVTKNTVLGEVINTNKQVKTDIKTILSDTSGEIFIPKLKQKINTVNNNRLIWILEGQLYNSPIHSFLNFYPDHKLNPFSYIFRTKIINHYESNIQFINTKKSIYEGFIKLNNKKYSFLNSKLEKLTPSIDYKNYLLTLDTTKYLVTIQKNYFKSYLKFTSNEKFGTLLTNAFLTATGGTCFYNFQNSHPNEKVLLFYKKRYSYLNDCEQLLRSIKVTEMELNATKEITRFQLLEQKLKKLQAVYKKFIKIAVKFEKICRNWSGRKAYSRTILWLGEERYRLKCDPDALLVEDGDFISKGLEIIPDCFSKTSGIVSINQEKKTTQLILVKSGLVYKSKKKKLKKKLYYPGEILFSKIKIQNISLCDSIGSKANDQFLVRPIQLYEVPYFISSSNHKHHQSFLTSCSQFKSVVAYSYKSKQQIYGSKNLSLVSNLLLFKTNNYLKKNIRIELVTNPSKKSIEFQMIEKLSLNNYVSPRLRDKNIEPCFLVQKNQFLSTYTTLGYLENFTSNACEIVKFKVKKGNEKQIFLISNENCITVKKSEIPNKNVDDFILSKVNLDQIGKIIIENKKFFTIQKGHLYFFPNCKQDNLAVKMDLRYKIIRQLKHRTDFTIPSNVSVTYNDFQLLVIKKNLNLKTIQKGQMESMYKFPKFFLKNTGKFYSCLLPQFVKQFTITDQNLDFPLKNVLYSKSLSTLDSFKKVNSNDLSRTLLLQNSELLLNPNRQINSSALRSQLTFVKFLEHPFTKSARAVGLHGITADYFEQEMNSLFCKNTEFIDSGKTLGLLNLEKEITGDIVQGLPRIEEILEARKKNMANKRIPTSQKKGLLAQKTSLDITFEFKKIGTAMKESDRINPHKLVKAYFNYYGLLKVFFCDQTNSYQYARLATNYEAVHKSFRKVQTFMLESVQSVYRSQGVTIHDKHLEVIIKQMTTKVLITSEGNTPLLQQEVIDLYHIQYINKILKSEKKQIAYYVPLLLGITKAALNNPSFISAASFQETTRVLTKAAIEGRIDWLRGLKENIIIGHLIPAGTGLPNYRNAFKNYSTKAPLRTLESLEFLQNSRQMQ